MKASRNWVWSPPNEAIETIASALSAHWTAAKSQQLKAFWPNTASWRTQLTSVRAAAGSSDTLPDLRPC